MPPNLWTTSHFYLLSQKNIFPKFPLQAMKVVGHTAEMVKSQYILLWVAIKLRWKKEFSISVTVNLVFRWRWMKTIWCTIQRILVRKAKKDARGGCKPHFCQDSIVPVQSRESKNHRRKTFTLPMPPCQWRFVCHFKSTYFLGSWTNLMGYKTAFSELIS